MGTVQMIQVDAERGCHIAVTDPAATASR